jgi:ribose transport system permease protein
MLDKIFAKLLKYNVLLVLLILCVGASLFTEEFLTPRNLQNVLLQVATDGIIAIGMTFVIITAGVDFSVGRVLALASVVAIGLQPHVGSLGASGLALLAGLAIGVLNGLLVTKVGIIPFISTLGMQVFVYGLALGVTNTRPISGIDPAFADLATTPVFGLPLAAVVFLVMVGVCHYVLSYTHFGRGFYAVGGNTEASWLSGIKVNAYLIAAYTFTAFTAALSGVLLASRINTGSPIIGEDTPLIVIAAVLMGGCSMTGGSGTILGTLQGVLVLGVLNNGMNLLGVPDFYQTIITGALLVLVMLIDRYSVSRAARAYQRQSIALAMWPRMNSRPDTDTENTLKTC